MLDCGGCGGCGFCDYDCCGCGCVTEKGKGSASHRSQSVGFVCDFMWFCVEIERLVVCDSIHFHITPFTS